jgi:hypothetical protein
VGTSCQTLTAAECHDAGGSYHGDGVSCAATPCGGGAGCPSGWAEDCVGICFPDAVFDEWLGDEFCDNAAYIPADSGFSTAPPGVYIYLACEAFLCDGGDCIGDPSSSCGPQCQGDVDADGDVDRADIVALIQAWSTTHAYADLDGDSNIDVQDLLLVCTYFGPCS